MIKAKQEKGGCKRGRRCRLPQAGRGRPLGRKETRNRSQKEGSQGVPSHPRGDHAGRAGAGGAGTARRPAQGTQVRGRAHGGEREGKDRPREE